MLPAQRAHIEAVMQTASHGPLADGPDAVIQASWLRCINEYRLDPSRMQEAVILPTARLREHQDQLEDFLQVARHGLETLYQQVAGMGYAVLLTDARGVTVDFIGDIQVDQSLRTAGLYLGSDWSEQFAGTCGVGTCISTGEAITVHRDDHFDATHIPLTCTCAPIYGAHGDLRAVLDISALTSPTAKASQHLALQLVKVYAQHVENASFLQRFRGNWVLRLGGAPQFLDVNPEYLLALDDGGCVIGLSRRAQQLLEPMLGGAVLGQPFARLFDAELSELGRFVPTHASDQRAITVSGSGRVLFMLASPPVARVQRARPVEPVSALPAPLAALCGGDAALSQQIARAARLVDSPVSLLVTGETGTGKEFFAKAMHASGVRRRRPFVAVNCAAIPEALIESELFGHLPGSFSGAGPKGKRGLIQEADGGTLFLDEIGDMPLALQARLLRVLAEREVLPIGATRPVPVDIRVIAATHCDLGALARAGRFRDDLYYRINGAHLMLPALRERSDLGWMIDRMLMPPRPLVPGREAPAALALSPQARDWLLAQPWPGNLRELHNVIEYARSVCTGGVVELTDLPDRLVAAPPLHAQRLSAAPSSAASSDAGEAEQLVRQLRAASWNVTEVARQLRISRMTLYRRMKRWNIASPNQRDGDIAGPPA